MHRYTTAVPLAEGATSVVYRAEEPGSGRPVALKVLASRDPAVASRFRREAAVLSRLEHPHIAPLLDHGETDGQPWLATAFVDGEPIDRAMADAGLEVTIGVFLQAVDAVAYAHDQRLLHRDLKPANILVRRGAENRPEAVVVDFGLARDLDEPSRTASGALLGTPAFMAPEQARGEPALRATDVYGLGAVLYATLTGRSPHAGANTGEVMAHVLNAEPERPTRGRPQLPLALEAVVMRCLARDPARRYGGVRQLAADLEAWLNGRTVTALRGYRWRLARGTLARHRMVAAGVAAAAVLALAMAGQFLWTQHLASEQRALALRLGESLGELRNRVRLIHLAPEHDTSTGLADIEARLSGLRAMADAGGSAGNPAVHFTLGRLLLELDRPGEALLPLQRARDLGCNTAACASTLAGARLALHRQELERRLNSLDADTGAGEQHHLESARQLLAALEDRSGVAGVQAAAVLGSLEQAERRARALLQEQPWQYRVLQALGEAYDRAGLRARQTDAIDEAAGHFRKSVAVFTESVKLARSFPAGYLGLCRGLLRLAELETISGQQVDIGAEALARCTGVSQIVPDAPRAYALPAMVLEQLASAAVRAGRSGASELVERARAHLDAAPEAVRQEPAILMARARVLLTGARAHGLSESDSMAALEKALTHVAQVTEMAPDDGAAWRLRANLALDLSNYPAADTEALARETATVARELARRWPESRAVRNTLGLALITAAYRERLAGRDGEALLHRGIEVLEALAKEAPDYLAAQNSLGLAWWEKAEYRIQQGRDPGPAAERAREQLRSVLRREPNHRSALINLSGVNLTMADYRLDRGLPPAGLAKASIELLDRVRQTGEYLPCDLALAHWLAHRAGETDGVSRVAMARRHAEAGDGTDCRRVVAELDGA